MSKDSLRGIPLDMRMHWRDIVARVDALETDVAEVVVKHGDRLDELERKERAIKTMRNCAKAWRDKAHALEVERNEIAKKAEAKDRTISMLNRSQDRVRNLLGGDCDPITAVQNIREAIGLARTETGMDVPRAVRAVIDQERAEVKRFREALDDSRRAFAEMYDQRDEQASRADCAEQSLQMLTGHHADAHQRGRDAERAAVVAWLRMRGQYLYGPAKRIENGEHVKPSPDPVRWRTFADEQPEVGQVIKVMSLHSGLAIGPYRHATGHRDPHRVGSIGFSDRSRWRPSQTPEET